MERAGKKKFICGFMGSGKSFMLKELSKATGELACSFTFLDLDRYILDNFTEDFDKNLADYINRVGLEEFRAAEKKALLDLLNDSNDYFIALGGGSLNSKTLNLLESHACGYWLNTPFDICYERIKNDHSRPLALKEKSDLLDLYTERLPFYSKFRAVNSVQEILHDLSGMV